MSRCTLIGDETSIHYTILSFVHHWCGSRASFQIQIDVRTRLTAEEARRELLCLWVWSGYFWTGMKRCRSFDTWWCSRWSEWLLWFDWLLEQYLLLTDTLSLPLGLGVCNCRIMDISFQTKLHSCHLEGFWLVECHRLVWSPCSTYRFRRRTWRTPLGSATIEWVWRCKTAELKQRYFETASAQSATCFEFLFCRYPWTMCFQQPHAALESRSILSGSKPVLLSKCDLSRWFSGNCKTSSSEASISTNCCR